MDMINKNKLFITLFILGLSIFSVVFSLLNKIILRIRRNELKKMVTDIGFVDSQLKMLYEGVDNCNLEEVKEYSREFISFFSGLDERVQKINKLLDEYDKENPSLK